MVIKQVADSVVVLNENFEVKMDVRDAKFKVVDETLVIVTKKGDVVAELPKANTAILYK